MTGNGSRRGDDDADRSFADHMEDRDQVTPLGPDRHARASGPKPAPRPTPESREATADALQFPDRDDPLVARRSFVRRAEMRDLRAGRIRPERRIDLHGERRTSAERRVREEIAQAARDRVRCLIVVTGRGRHSEGGAPVLREQLPRWLGSAALAGHVAAFAPAIDTDGGRGAVYVLLR